MHVHVLPGTYVMVKKQLLRVTYTIFYVNSRRAVATHCYCCSRHYYLLSTYTVAHSSSSSARIRTAAVRLLRYCAGGNFGSELRFCATGAARRVTRNTGFGPRIVCRRRVKKCCARLFRRGHAKLRPLSRSRRIHENTFRRLSALCQVFLGIH